MTMKSTLLFVLLFLSTYSSTVGQAGFYARLADSTLTLTKQNVRYDPAPLSVGILGWIAVAVVGVADPF
jgi:hypothetical protein